MRKFALLFVLMPILAWANITPDILSKNIDKSGSENAVNHLQEDEWNVIFKEIAAGNKAWLDLMPTLAPFTDAKRSVSLEDAIAEALTTNTSEALNTLKVLDANKYPFVHDWF
ncbi:hypothetical protein [Xenorhabdus szentirmaii]|uniref:Uncharacterized protein n=1 Tax=Xenorhabdus szentirmaii TaxID=290112 RepID=A0AAW3YVT3_9GAMM|nr:MULTISPECIES: hypothetical protein [unclassified Xenorhabdus]MBD2781799.1 hypothetical protein [Xenorhabdus sp. 38]MBD2793279.1 hypothetical protein [Xenorhabdus sp. CUL]MBD2801406.1 hypothetical protein [Xenorhabdus sp. M]MBD2804816.1 hypothetical protein [Xenorhabdus sp. ZM]MBD2825857.1 hypothetical protein [Xenorhabdus sp. 5]